MPYLVMQGDLYLACSKPFRLSKKMKAAKNWNNDELAKKAIKVMAEQGIDTTGMVVKSTRAAHKEEKEKAVSSAPVSTEPKRRGRPPKEKTYTGPAVIEKDGDVQIVQLQVSENVMNQLKELKAPHVSIRDISHNYVAPSEEAKNGMFEVVKQEPQSSAEVQAAFSGVNAKCLTCTKDCKQTYKTKIVFCPIYRESKKYAYRKKERSRHSYCSEV